jgi:hypothetical protein
LPLTTPTAWLDVVILNEVENLKIDFQVDWTEDWALSDY